VPERKKPQDENCSSDDLCYRQQEEEIFSDDVPLTEEQCTFTGFI
jgi:hypothetical protein